MQSASRQVSPRDRDTIGVSRRRYSNDSAGARQRGKIAPTEAASTGASGANRYVPAVLDKTQTGL
eukprot:1640558-Pleurochrysis_carterae.AAC.3